MIIRRAALEDSGRGGRAEGEEEEEKGEQGEGAWHLRLQDDEGALAVGNVSYFLGYHCEVRCDE